MDLIERTFQREGSLYIACLHMLSSHLMQSEIIIYGLVRKCEALTFLLDNIYIRFGSKLYRQIVGIPMVLTVPLL